MGKKESNEVRMTGVLPSQGADPIPVGKIPDGGTQVVKDAAVANSTATIHTVTAGKTLHLTLIIYEARNDNVATKNTLLYVTDGDDNTQYYLNGLSLQTTSQLKYPMPFNPPLEIIAGWKIKIISDANDCVVRGFIHGYEA